jgi:hypothetical protein
LLCAQVIFNIKTDRKKEPPAASRDFMIHVIPEFFLEYRFNNRTKFKNYYLSPGYGLKIFNFRSLIILKCFALLDDKTMPFSTAAAAIKASTACTLEDNVYSST